MSKLTRDSVPEGFTVPMALVDSVPVVFFGINTVLLGLMFHSALFVSGAILCFLSGALKVLWKFIVAIAKKNVWWLFLQMRILMPIGFLIMLLSPLLNPGTMTFRGLWHGFSTMPSLIFFALGILGMCLMMVFAKLLDNSDPKSNWVEQATNGISQIFIFVGILLLAL